MAEVYGQATPLTIRELTGEKREILLAGRALPYRPVQFSGAMRAEFTWYPGNPEATAQILGAQEEETTFTGMWKDRFIREPANVPGGFTAVAQLDGTQLDSVPDVAEAIDDFRRKGQLVRFQWGRIVRHGILTKFVQRWDRAEDLTWDMTFTWTGFGEVPAPAVLSSQGDLGRIKANMDAIFGLILIAKDANPFNFAGTIGAAINTIVANIQARVNEITDTVSQVVTATSSASSVAQRLASIHESLKEETDNLNGTLRAQPPAAVFIYEGSSGGLGGDSTQPTFGSQLRAEKYVRDLYDLTQQMRRLAAEQQYSAAKLVVPTLLAVYIAKNGDDLRDVAQAYYGSQAEWRVLLTFNELSSSELSAGQPVLVPRQETAQS